MKQNSERTIYISGLPYATPAQKSISLRDSITWNQSATTSIWWRLVVMAENTVVIPKIGVRLEFKRNNTRKLAPPTFANGPIEGVAKTVFCPLVEECFLTST